jgi:TolB-like protein
MRGWVCVALLLALAAHAEGKRTVAVTYFDVNGGGEDYRALGKGLADMLITDLFAVKSIALVEREKLNVALDELKLAKSPYIDPKSAVKLGKGLSATHLLTGAINVVGGKMRIDARVLEVESGEVKQSKNVEGDAQEFFALEKELVELLVAALDLKPDLKEKAALRKSQTESFDAIRGYSKGLDALDRGDSSAAQAAFAAASKADPAWPALKTALERLNRTLDAADAKAAQGLDQKLEALRPDDPELTKKCEKLSEPEGVPYADRYTAKLQVLTALMKRGLRPEKPRYAGHKIGASKVSHWEADELLSLLGWAGDDPQAIAATPVILEYLVRRYADDPTFVERVDEEVERRWAKQFTRTDFNKAPPKLEGSGDNVDRHRAHYAWLNAHAKAVPLPVGASRDPMASFARLQELLAKERTRRKAEYEAELKRRIAELDTTDNFKAGEQLGDLESAVGEERDRFERIRRRVQLTRWMVEHPALRPMRGTLKQPVYLEESELLGWMTSFDADPDSWPLVPAAGEYLLKKYPDAPYLTSQLRLHLQSIEGRQKDERARGFWEKDVQKEEQRSVADEVHALFKRAGEQGRDWK